MNATFTTQQVLIIQILVDINKRERGSKTSPPPTFVSGEQCPIQTGGGHEPPIPTPAPSALAAQAAR